MVDGNGMGVEGVKIIVDGHERSITDNQGYYKLDQVLELIWVNDGVRLFIGKRFYFVLV